MAGAGGEQALPGGSGGAGQVARAAGSRARQRLCRAGCTAAEPTRSCQAGRPDRPRAGCAGRHRGSCKLLEDPPLWTYCWHVKEAVHGSFWQLWEESESYVLVSCQSSRTVVEAGKVAELEAAQAAAQAALLAEMDLLRRQKAAAEEQARRLETQARVPSHQIPYL